MKGRLIVFDFNRGAQWVWMEYAGPMPTCAVTMYRVGPRTVSTMGKLAVGVCVGYAPHSRLCVVQLFAETAIENHPDGTISFPEPNGGK